MRGWSRRAFVLGCVSGALSACSSGVVGGPASQVPYSVGVSDTGNALTIHQIAADPSRGYTASVLSERGIGEATVAWWGHPAPHQLIFHLQLRGLEHFSLLWGGLAVNLTVNSVDHAVYATLKCRNGDESALTRESPYWMDVVSAPDDAVGYLIAAPPAFVQDWPAVWAITWIDFYR